jgi:redox-sensitive bicupin YhaK (pirin superfamily)
MLLGKGKVSGFQLWVAMPPVVEDGPSFGQYIPPDEVPGVSIDGGEVKVFLGSFNNVSSPITSHQDMNYYVISLERGQTWRYKPPVEHNVGFAFCFDGNGLIQGETNSGELIIFEGEGDIEISTQADSAKVLLGTAKKHPYSLVLGTSSVHTNAESLKNSLARISLIGANLKHA